MRRWSSELRFRRHLLGRFGDLVREMAGLMISAELAQRGLVQRSQDIAQLLGFGITRRETWPVNLTQGAEQRVSVLAADFAILVGMPVVETCLAHVALPCTIGWQHLPAEIKWQLRPQTAGNPPSALTHPWSKASIRWLFAAYSVNVANVLLRTPERPDAAIEAASRVHTGSHSSIASQHSPA